MERAFWIERWESGQTAFHQREVNPMLRSAWPDLRVPDGARVFVPLCGKTRDMLWLRERGHEVVGVELSPIAVREFFEDNRLTPRVTQQGAFESWSAEGVTLLCGDLFDLTPADLAGVGAVYDRASLIALPPEMRERYAAKMADLIGSGAPTLLITIAYPEGEMRGPPFSVSEAEVRRLYAGAFDVSLVSSADALEGNPHLRERGLTRLAEQTFVLRRR